MSEPHESYVRNQSLRISNLEQQVHLLQAELQRLRNGVLQENDVGKLVHLKAKLKEVNAMLIELRTYYNSLQEPIPKSKEKKADQVIHTGRTDKAENENLLETPTKDNTSLEAGYTKTCFDRENAGFDPQDSFGDLTEKEVTINRASERISETARSNDPFKTCKQLMKEIQPPGSILGNYLTRLQDFRADPELRRQRWERKQQERLQSQQMKNPNNNKPLLEDKATLTEDTNSKNAKYLTASLNYPTFGNSDIKMASRGSDSSSSSQYTETDCKHPLQMPIVRRNLMKVVEKFTSSRDKKSIVLTLVLENDLYHLCISQVSNGQQLACYSATEEAVQEAKHQHLFQDFLTFFIVNAENSKLQKDRVLGHLFEFIQIDSN